MFTIGRIAYRREGVFFSVENALSVGKGDGSAQRGLFTPVIYYFFLFFAL